MLGHATHGTDFHAVIVMFERTANGEQHRADDAVGEHHEQGGCPAKRLHGSDTNEDDTHVRNRGVGHHFLEVGLSKADHCTPNQ